MSLDTMADILMALLVLIIACTWTIQLVAPEVLTHLLCRVIMRRTWRTQRCKPEATERRRQQQETTRPIRINAIDNNHSSSNDNRQGSCEGVAPEQSTREDTAADNEGDSAVFNLSLSDAKSIAILAQVPQRRCLDNAGLESH